MAENPSGNIKNFPTNPRARIQKIRGTDYVVIREGYKNSAGLQRTKTQYLGRIVDGVFYTMQEYKEHFSRTGQARKELTEKQHARIFHRRKKASYAYSNVKNMPQGDDITVLRNKSKTGGEHLYVIQTTVVEENGKRSRVRRYLGKIVGNNYYTMEEYRLHFRRDGSRRPRAEVKQLQEQQA